MEDSTYAVRSRIGFNCCPSMSTLSLFLHHDTMTYYGPVDNVRDVIIGRLLIILFIEGLGYRACKWRF